MRKIVTPQVQYDAFALKGGLDQVTPILSLPPGAAREALNFEVSVNGGYTRIDGYERYDGRPPPSAASYVGVTLDRDFSVSTGDAVQNGTGTVTGVVARVIGRSVYITKGVGVWNVTDTMISSGSFLGVISAIPDPLSSYEDARTRAAAADIYRADIGEVPGSGPIRGLAWLGTTLYAWRDDTADLELPVTWDATRVSGTWTLSGSNKTADYVSGVTYGSVVGTESRSTGKRYIEFKFNSGGAYGASVIHDMGLTEHRPPSLLTNGAALGMGYRRAGRIIYNNVTLSTVTALSAGDVIGIAIDFDTGQAWFSRNNTWVSGDPAAGTSPSVTFTPGAVYYPFASMESGGALSTTIRSLASEFTGTVPSGFSSWGSVVGTPTASAASIYKSTTSGWTEVPLGYELQFNSGTGTAIVEGDTVTNLGATATGVVSRVVLESGTTWAAGSGRLILSSVTGTWSAADQIRVAGSQRATCVATQSAITLNPGGRVQTVTASLGGNLVAQKLYGCDGVNRGFEFDGTVYVPIRITGLTSTQDKPAHVAVHKNYLFFAIGNSVQNSGLATPYVWSAILGASEIALPENVTGMRSLPTGADTAALLITTQRNIQILYGLTPASVGLGAFDRSTGAANYTVQQMADAFMLDDRGVVQMTMVQGFANFDTATLTYPIRPFIVAHRGLATASLTSRSKGQYRVFYSDGWGFYLTTVNGKVIGSMPVYFPTPVNVVCEGTAATGEVQSWFGSGTDGYVYQLDSGPDFDGTGIPAYLTLNFNPQGASRVLKRYRRASLEVNGTSYVEMDVGFRLGYDSTAIDQPSSATYSSPLSGAAWDTFTWDNFYWDNRTLGPIEVNCNGTAENIALAVNCSSRYVDTFTINSATLHYSARRGIR